jgi:hypothetical protein
MADGMKPVPTGELANLLPPINSYSYVPRVDYEYFEGHETNRFKWDADQFEMVNAWWLADAAMLAYAKPEIAEVWCKKAGFKEFDWFGGKNTGCFVATAEKYAFIVFRGTRAPGKGQSLRNVGIDWSLDFHTELAPLKNRGRVHSGFKEGLEQVWEKAEVSTSGTGLREKLESLRNREPRPTLWFTGHSLGAGLATLAMCKYEFGEEANLYTFGSPLVGDREFQRSFDFRAWRFVNDTDIITRSPSFGFLDPLKWPFAEGYHPVGELKFIDQNGNIGPTEVIARGRIHFFTFLSAKLRRTREKFANHAPLRYTIAIWNNHVKETPGMSNVIDEEVDEVYEKPRSIIWKLAGALLLILLIVGSIQYWVWNRTKEHHFANAFIIENGLGSDRDEFYTLPEGSEMFPKALADSAKYYPNQQAKYVTSSIGDGVAKLLQPVLAQEERPFLEGLERFGFIPVPKTPGNPLGYIGLTVAKREGTGLDMIGVNCAACHVGQIEYHGHAIRIDGAPNMLDIFGFIFALKDSVRLLRLNLIGAFENLPQIDFKSISFNGLRVYAHQTTTLGQYQAGLPQPNTAGTAPLNGRADAFGTARSAFFADFRPMSAPASYPHIWGMEHTALFHWNANTNSVLERNVGQALGLGAGIDLADCRTTIRFDYLDQMEKLAYKIKAPAWPAGPELLPAFDPKAAERGKVIYMGDKGCARCHDNYPTGKDGTADVNEYLLFSLNAIGTDPNEALNFAPSVKVRSDACHGNNGPLEWMAFDKAHETVLGSVRVETEVKEVGNQEAENQNGRYDGNRGKPKWIIQVNCGTGDARNCPVYPAKPLVGIWATAPYLHNGSVPTIWDLLAPEEDRPKQFKIGQREYDPVKLGYAQENLPADAKFTPLDTKLDGNHNTGHLYGQELTTDQKHDLIEFLKSLKEGDQAKLRCEIRKIPSPCPPPEKAHK